jgi:subtilisin family serine protease
MQNSEKIQIGEKILAEVIFGGTGVRRFSQDSPILPDVWMEYGKNPDGTADLLLNPYMEESPGKVARVLSKRLQDDRERRQAGAKKAPGIAFNQSTVVARLYFGELVRVVLPMTRWWNEYVWANNGENFNKFLTDEGFRKEIAEKIHGQPQVKKGSKKAAKKSAGKKPAGVPPPADSQLLWMVKIIGPLALAREGKTTLDIEKCIQALARKQEVSGTGEEQAPDAEVVTYTEEIVAALYRLLKTFKPVDSDDLLAAKSADRGDLMPGDEDEAAVRRHPNKKIDEREEARKRSLLWTVTLNRAASATVWLSTSSVKADAARLLFEVSCKNLGWAVIDSGVDARHPAFFDWEKIKEDNALIGATSGAGNSKKKKGVEEQPDAWQNYTRVTATYDFRLIRNILSFDELSEEDQKSLPPRLKRIARTPEKLKKLRDGLNRGNNIDWDALMPFLRIPHDKDYRPPGFEHGTHVAGILAGDWPKEEPSNFEGKDIKGVCPDIRIYDLRVLDDNGQGDEFSTIAAMQFIRYLNANKERLVMHGANMSLSIRHNVRNYACGCTPVCDESERMINAGIVVVAAAGNDGYRSMIAGEDTADSYRSISITDPGNADAVITVGSTHRERPHAYGVSFFSSRGPTGDGRVKPDLVAPGEKIVSAIPNSGMKPLDGTSMAAPHVSGAAALLIARYSELMGQPKRIKEILCSTATDLGRERYFQGHGMLDILRAMQSI